jgi:hypothetical protein
MTYLYDSYSLLSLICSHLGPHHFPKNRPCPNINA